MIYADNAKVNINEALQMFRSFSEKGSMSKNDQIKFCISCQKYLESYVRWMECSPADAKAYQIFVKSTPFWDMLELPPNKWHQWLDENIKEDALV